MASSNESRKYPGKLYSEGRSPLHRRSMHHNCLLKTFIMLRESIGDVVYNEIRDNSQVGVILKLADSDYVWWANAVHHLLTHQLSISRKYEIWSLIEGSPIRFSLHEFEEYTGLNCETIDVQDQVEVDHRDFWDDLKVDAGVGPNWNDLDVALQSCSTWKAEKRRMLGLLYVLHVGILGISRSSRIPLEYAKRVLDAEAFERFPWGRVGFKELIESIKVVSFDNNSYAIRGCVHVLFIWALESLKNFGERFGNKIVTDPGEEIVPVPLLRWKGGRPRVALEAFFAEEKRKNKKVEAINIHVKPRAEIYPVWPGENAVLGAGEGPNKLLDNLLDDILNGRLDESQCDDVSDQASGKKEKRKQKHDTEHADFLDPPDPKRIPSVKMCMGGMQLKDRSGAIAELREFCISMKVGMDRNQKLMESLDVKVESMAVTLNTHDRKIYQLQTKQNKTEDATDFHEFKEVRSKQNKTEDAGDDAESNTGDGEYEESWMVERKQISGNSASFLRAVRKRKTQYEPTLPENTKKAETDVRVKLDTNRKSIKVEHKEEKQPRISPTSVTKTTAADVKKRQGVVALKGTKIKEEYPSPPSKGLVGGFTPPTPNQTQQYKPKAKANYLTPEPKKKSVVSDDYDGETKIENDLSSALDKLCPTLGVGHDDEPRDHASFLVRFGSFPSDHIYDPFEKLSKERSDRLKGWVSKKMAKKHYAPGFDVEFYHRIMAPRESWPSTDYGWLWDSVRKNLFVQSYHRVPDLFYLFIVPQHLCPIMSMLRGKLQQENCPFTTDRMEFVDPWFVRRMVKDFEDFTRLKKAWVFPVEYVQAYNGIYRNGINFGKKRWLKDVDTLYLFHNVKGVHWVALQVSLRGRSIGIYDSSMEWYEENTVLKTCMPYAKMIPALLHALATDEEKKDLNLAPYRRYRYKEKIPQNDQIGDCGVYAFKYIECLALGLQFVGLCDDAIPDIREKLAADLFDFVPHSECFLPKRASNNDEDTEGVEVISEVKRRVSLRLAARS